MLADLKRCQELAQPLRWKIEQRPDCLYRMYEGCEMTIVHWTPSLAPIRAHLEAEYRNLAEQAYHAYDVAKSHCEAEERLQPLAGRICETIADELAVKEPTMVERLHEARRRTDRPVAKAIETMLDALIDLYEREGR